MCLLKVLFKLNLVTCKESWYSQKNILGKPLACNILYIRKKKGGKKLLLRALLSLSLKVDEMDIWLFK